ncbi:MAG TPA: UDP-N-acetylmuramoyl-tripeptide--D-alanyl-D-alanine ligase [Hanamia sp.]
MNIENIYNVFIKYHSIQTDTRKLQKGDLFFALKGPNFNGNLFARQALDDGAAYVVADEKLSFSDERVIQVDDALQTLQQLAKFHREQFNIPFIAITGSNGKTTTKELVHEVLASQYKTYTTKGNLNNHIGVPLTILKIKADAEMAVIEMGANHLKEIEGYCQYAQPTHGLITNIGKAHLEGFGGAENVKKGKGELFEYIKQKNGIAFVNADDANVLEVSQNLKNIIYYGSSGENSTGHILRKDPFLELAVGKEGLIKTNLVGAYNLPNVLAAVCIGEYFKVDFEKIKKAIENYAPSNSRSQLIKLKSNSIILDAYNANPGSMAAAIENFASMNGDKKILLLGDMKELGQDSQKEHAAIISLIDKHKWKYVVLVGENFSEINHGYISFENSTQAREWFQKEDIENAQILIKGSRSMQMEKVIE